MDNASGEPKPNQRPPGNYLAMLEVLLCLLLFTACALHVRIRLKNSPAPTAVTTAAIVTTDTSSGTTPARQGRPT